MSFDRSQMDFGEVGGMQPSQTSIDAHHNDSLENFDSQSAQHEPLVTTVPRKRLALNVENGKIAGHVVVRNRSRDLVAFKNQVCDREAYVINPDRGVLKPNEEVDVTLKLSDNCPPDRNIDNDHCTLIVAPYNLQQHPDLDAYFDSSAFEYHEKQQKQIMTAGISPDVKRHLETLAEEQRTQVRQTEGVSYFRSVIGPAFGVFCGILALYVLLTEFCQPLYEPERPRRGGSR